MNDIILPSPQLDLDYPLMKALQERRTIRKWKNESLSMQEVSNILWCACGETKAAYGKAKNKRTVPSGCNSQLVSIYVAIESGVYKYNEPEHKLEHILDKDIRGSLSKQKILQSAPFGLVYVADCDKKMGIMKSSCEQKMFFSSTECGGMSQNVLFVCGFC